MSVREVLKSVELFVVIVSVGDQKANNNKKRTEIEVSNSRRNEVDPFEKRENESSEKQIGGRIKRGRLSRRSSTLDKQGDMQPGRSGMGSSGAGPSWLAGGRTERDMGRGEGTDALEVRGSSYRLNPPPFSVDDYVRRSTRYLDAERFESIDEEPPGVRYYNDDRGGCRDYRLGAWMDRWAHASLLTLRYEIPGPSDLLYVRTREELRWVNAFEGVMRLILNNEVVFASAEEVDAQRVVKNFYMLSYYREWTGWVRDLSFELRLRHRPKRTD